MRSIWTIICIIGGILVFFTFIFIIITKTSPMGDAIKSLKRSKSQAEVVEKWNENIDFQTNRHFRDAVKNKLSKFDLSNEDRLEWIERLQPPTSLNLIVVPSLSRRIIDEVNNPDQIQNDTILLHHIWRVFENHTRTRTTRTRCRLIVDIADREQAGGEFRTIANNLIFDLSEYGGETNRSFFADGEARSRYLENIRKLYELGKNRPLGADYWTYFRQDLSRHIRQPTLSDNYRNVLIIITSGYLEAEHYLHTGDWPTRNVIANRIRRGMSVEEAVGNRIRISDINQRFPTLEVLILEVNKRRGENRPKTPREERGGIAEDYDILQFLWTDWFKRLEIKNANDSFFIRRNNATRLTKRDIDNFLSR